MQLTPAETRQLREMFAWYRQQKARHVPHRQTQRARMIPPPPAFNFKAPEGGIPGRVGLLEGSAECELLNNNPTTGMLELSGVTVTVRNWVTSAVCTEGDRYGAGNWINGLRKAIADDCNDEGSSSSMNSTSTFNDIPDDFDDAVTPMSSGGVFNEIGVTFHSGVDVIPD